MAKGYTADKQYNALYGHKQLYFVDVPHAAAGGRAGRPAGDVPPVRASPTGWPSTEPTLPPAELLLSKLQIVKINRKDILDSLALLSEYPLAEDDGGGQAITCAASPSSPATTGAGGAP